ncbi:3-dehydroquinate synthase [Candidatus Protochlamydia phocaeensis]|uniref:3-dehydroquinate synthase n=1 Tax=Candidatus Protochlamydia phocaeensis TaxID=1414722 RepID=UPI000838184A|nr:3-dehydroquinate synthase [Candidatus Protochlamydia phocaeensis]
MTLLLECSIEGSSHAYPIEIKEGMLKESTLAQRLVKWGERFAIIADSVVASLFGKQMQALLLAQGLEAFLFSFPAGESSKSREIKEQLENQMFEQGLGKDTCLIALGGGVSLDLGGYLAATYCRGIPLVMIPTSLLAMVDASIGGKNGVNVPYGKNLIGCFKQPEMVCIDPIVLKTLPQKEFRNGIVEMIKHGFIADAAHIDYLTKHAQAFQSLSLEIVKKAIWDSCRIKQEIVEQDPHEKGKRRLLNFGHTVGHALELLTGFSLPHGEAVAIGMLTESYVAVELGYLDRKVLELMHALLKAFSLPFILPTPIYPQDMMRAMELDKKSQKKLPRIVLLQDIGVPLSCHSEYCAAVDEKIFMNALHWMNDALCCH